MLRPWKMKLAVQRDHTLPVHLQIAQYLADEIRRGRLVPGSALPGTREVAADLAVNRKTVVLAFEELAAQGWVSTQGRRGTFVAARLPGLLPEARAHAAAASPIASGEPPYSLYGQALEHAPAGGERAAVVFSDGVPDARLIPYDVLGRAYRRALIDTARRNGLGYGDPRGDPALRQSVARMLADERGLQAGPGNVCIVRGSQMGIYLAARLLVRPGDHVAVEALSYPPAREAFRAAGAEVHGLAMDADGMRPDELEKLCRRTRIRAVYLTPHHQFPTTRLMPAERRVHLLMLAEQFDFAIVEDDYDHEFHFSHRPMFPMASVDRSGRVIYVGSLSKVLAPGLRVGYVVGAPALIDRCAAEILLIDRQGNPVTERAVSDLMDSGELKRHIRRALRVYEARRSLMAGRAAQLPPQVAFTLPPGGLALWLRLDSGVDDEALIRLAREEGVQIPSSRPFCATGGLPGGLRLGYASLAPAEIEAGLDGLARALGRLPA